MRMAAGLVVACLGFVVGWATFSLFAQPSDVVTDSQYALVAVEEGEVGSSISVASKATWARSPLANNLAAGVVTDVRVSQGSEVTAGTVLYTVDLRPVVIAAGVTPSFRDLQRGVAGADVAQLQDLLTSLGFYAGPVNGTFNGATTAAVREWQAANGVSADGLVRAGDVLFVPELPTRVALDESIIYRGNSVSGGEKVLSGLGISPTFRLAVTDIQAALMPPGAKVEITGPTGATWLAKISRERTEENGAIEIVLESNDQESICGDDCSEVSVDGDTSLLSRVVLTEQQSGLVVPTSAILTEPDGQAILIDSKGKPWEVVVVVSARGMSLIEGVERGLLVRAPGTESQ